MTWLIWVAIIVASVVADQLTKLWMVNWIGPGAERGFVEVIDGFFSFTYHENTGIAFSIGADNDVARVIFMTVSTVAILGLAAYLFFGKVTSKWCCVSIALIVGGGIGNMIDRVRLGYVVDFLDFYGIWNAVFNVADCFVCVGGGMLFLWCVIELIREAKKEKAKKKGTLEEDAEASKENSD